MQAGHRNARAVQRDWQGQRGIPRVVHRDRILQIKHPRFQRVDPEPDRYPVMSTKYNVIFGINKNEPELAEAVNGAIRDVWKECLNVKAMAKYGLGDKAWFVPPANNPRLLVDRPADYKAPTADHCF